MLLAELHVDCPAVLQYKFKTVTVTELFAGPPWEARRIAASLPEPYGSAVFGDCWRCHVLATEWVIHTLY